MKLFSKNMKRITAAVLSALLLCAAPLSYADDTVADMEAKQTELANKKADLENKISSLESQEADKTEYLTLLSEKIDTIKEQIDTANSDITVLNTSIKKLEKELSDSADQISDTMELLKKRLAVLYSAGCTVGTLEILFNSESLHDFSMRAEAVSTITRHDKQLIDTVAAYMNETKAQREELEKEKTALADAKKLYESSEEELKQLESDNTALLEQIRSDKSSAETELSRTEEEEYVLANMMAAKIAEMQQQMAQAKSTPTPTPVPTVEPTPTPTPVPEEEVDDNGNVMPTPTPTPVPTVKPTPTPTPVPQPSYDDDYSGESFAWPVPGWTGVSCAFGNGHYGMDIPASRGTPIVASRSGTVMTANGSDDWGYSWGYYVSIYHDSTYSTLYAHMSSVAVSEGQWVNKGDVIGYVGDTGYSFGDHCHFEVYQNGTRVDPSQFV